MTRAPTLGVPIPEAVRAISFLVLLCAVAHAGSLPAPGFTDTLVLSAIGDPPSLASTFDGPIDYSNTLTNSGVTLTLNSRANVESGVFDASDTWTLSSASSYWTVLATTASFIDQIMITSPTESAGTAGALLVSYEIDGTISGTGGLESLVVGYQDSSPGGTETYTSEGTEAGPGTWTFDIPFYYGYAFDFDSAISVSVSLNSGLGGSTDFTNQAIINSLVTLTQPGNVADSTITSTMGNDSVPDGTVYLPDIDSPEPGSIALLAFGLLGILAVRRF